MADILADDNSDNSVEFTINKGYAEKYDQWRGKEELQKFTSRYGETALSKLNDSDEDDSSSSSEEDDDAKEWTPQLEKQFFKTLSYLKKRDPKIYDSDTKFFEKQPNAEDTTKDDVKKKDKKKEKPMFLKDYERKMLLERGGQISSDEDEEKFTNRTGSPTFVEEQKNIKQSFRTLMQNDSDNEESGIGGLFQPRQKTKEEKEKEEEDYKQWLLGKKDELENSEEVSELSTLKSYWSDPKLDEKEAFLRDYILNQRYLEEHDKDYIPSYEEVVHDSDGGFSEDERTVDEMEQFEHKYNFRFEEPDQDFIKRYPRTTQSSVRQKDERRKIHRDEVKERKAREKEAKRQELKQLKAIKRKEIAERLEKLKEITGNTDVDFQDNDLNEDFDPEKHDKRMQQLFDTEFYDGEEGDEKPEFPDLDEELEIEKWDEYQPEEGGSGANNNFEPHCEDPDFNMDCDYDPRASLEQEMLANQQSRRKKKRKRSKLAEVLSKKKPCYDNKEHVLDIYMDEYYSLDYEDLINDIPCRFKYRPVTSNDFGLTAEEILMADDKELNRWCSLKKTCQYRSDNQEYFDVQAYKKKANMEELKRKILPSLYRHEEGAVDEEANEDGNTSEVKKTKKKKKKNKRKPIEDGGANPQAGDQPQPEPEDLKAEKSPKKRKHDSNPATETSLDVIKSDASPAKKKMKSEVQSTENVDFIKLESAPLDKKKKMKSDVESTDDFIKLDSSCLPAKKKFKSENTFSSNADFLSLKTSKCDQHFNVSPGENDDVPKFISSAFSPKNAKNKNRNFEKKNNSIESGATTSNASPMNVEGKKSKKKKKNKKKSAQSLESNKSQNQNGVQNSKFVGRNNKMKSHGKGTAVKQDISESRLKAFGINPKKFKNKQKYGKKR